MNQMIFPGWNIFVSVPFHPGNVNLIPNFYKDCSLQFVSCFCMQFSPMPLYFYLLSLWSVGGPCWRRKSTNRFQAPCTPSTANPVLVRHYSFMSWADIDFCFVPLHKFAEWNLFIQTYPLKCAESTCACSQVWKPAVFYKVKVKGASKYANLRLQNYVNSGRCWLHTSKRPFSVPVYYTQ